jgi:nucleoside-diphosphate-sugar epimerase
MSKRAPSHPVFYIHTSGTGLLTWETAEKNAYGTELPKVYDDWESIKEVTSIPDSALHRLVDKIVLRMSSINPQAVRTAIVCPPCIYARGRGPDNQRSLQVYEAAKAILKRRKAFLPMKGQNIWQEVNVHDLSDLYVLLGEAAAVGGGNATWNEDGYYFAENGSFVWKDVFQEIARIAKKKGLIESEEIPSISADELAAIHPFAIYIWASNSRGKAIRARQLLGWEPHGPSLKQDLPSIVDGEARALGLIEGHAAKVVH